MVGGVSIGAFMGALYCIERNTTTLTQKAREWSKVWRKIHKTHSNDRVTLIEMHIFVLSRIENDPMVSTTPRSDIPNHINVYGQRI